MKKLLFLLTLFSGLMYAQYSPDTYCADVGSTDSYACNLVPAPAALVTGQTYYFKANTNNTGAATINFNTLGAKTIVKLVAPSNITTDLSDNDILVGQLIVVTYDGTNMQMQSPLGNQQASITYVNGLVAGISSGGAGNQPNQTVSGCGVEDIATTLNVTVGVCNYAIAGVSYTSPLANLTFTAADPTNGRIDGIIVDNTGVASVLTGTPGVTPLNPTVDPTTQLALTFMLIPAMGTAPQGVVVTTLYDENVEWTCTPTANINCASTNNPYHGTKDIEATAAVLNNNFTLVKPAAGTVDLSTQNNLTFYIRSKAQWPTGKSGGSAARFLSLYWQNGSTQVGNQIVLRDGTFGFSSSTTTTYQQINIPTGLFQTGSNLVTTLKVIVSGNTGTSTIGWYIDEVTLQSGFNPPSLPSTLMNFKGVWSSSTAYSTNDTVVSGSVGYVALVANTNVAVSTASTWAALATGKSNELIRTIGASFGSFQSGATALSAAATACVPTYFSGTIQAVEVIADVSGTATFNVLAVAHGSWTGTASATSISGGTFTMTTAAFYTDTTLTGWTKPISAGTDFCFAMTSPSTVAGLSITLKVAAN